MAVKRWAEARTPHVEAIGADRVAQGTAQLLSRVRAARLADIRKRQGLTQRDVASSMGVSVGRVSQIESGSVSGVDVLDRYVTALGGRLEFIATFGEEQLRVG